MGRPGLTDHRKFKRLTRAVGSATQARGGLEFMWDAANQNGDEYLGDALDVEAACHWDGEPGFIEEVPEQPGHYRVHDLFDHAPEYVQKRMVRELARKQRGVTISDLRREAGKRGRARQLSEQTAATVGQAADSCPEIPANVGQTAANGDHLQTVALESGQTAANGETPAPAPARARAPARESQSQKQKRAAPARPPSVDEVRAYCQERKNSIDAQRFNDYYAARGWKLSRGIPMRDWKAAVRTWERRDQEKAAPPPKIKASGFLSGPTPPGWD